MVTEEEKISRLLPPMKVTSRRAVIEDAEVLLELINAAYEHERKWKVGDRTSLAELNKIIPNQSLDSETGDYQVLLVMVADESEDLSSIPPIAMPSRIVGHIRYVTMFRQVSLFSISNHLANGILVQSGSERQCSILWNVCCMANTPRKGHRHKIIGSSR